MLPSQDFKGAMWRDTPECRQPARLLTAGTRIELPALFALSWRRFRAMGASNTRIGEMP